MINVFYVIVTLWHLSSFYLTQKLVDVRDQILMLHDAKTVNGSRFSALSHSFHHACVRKSTCSTINFNMKLKLFPDNFLYFFIGKSHRQHFPQSFRGTHVVKAFSTSFGQPPSDPKTSLVPMLSSTSASILTNWITEFSPGINAPDRLLLNGLDA